MAIRAGRACQSDAPLGIVSLDDPLPFFVIHLSFLYAFVDSFMIIFAFCAPAEGTLDIQKDNVHGMSSDSIRRVPSILGDSKNRE